MLVCACTAFGVEEAQENFARLQETVLSRRLNPVPGMIPDSFKKDPCYKAYSKFFDKSIALQTNPKCLKDGANLGDAQAESFGDSGQTVQGVDQLDKLTNPTEISKKLDGLCQNLPPVVTQCLFSFDWATYAKMLKDKKRCNTIISQLDQSKNAVQGAPGLNELSGSINDIKKQCTGAGFDFSNKIPKKISNPGQGSPGKGKCDISNSKKCGKAKGCNWNKKVKKCVEVAAPTKPPTKASCGAIRQSCQQQCLVVLECKRRPFLPQCTEKAKEDCKDCLLCEDEICDPENDPGFKEMTKQCIQQCEVCEGCLLEFDKTQETCAACQGFCGQCVMNIPCFAHLRIEQQGGQGGQGAPKCPKNKKLCNKSKKCEWKKGKCAAIGGSKPDENENKAPTKAPTDSPGITSPCFKAKSVKDCKRMKKQCAVVGKKCLSFDSIVCSQLPKKLAKQLCKKAKKCC